jgi:hypothetical protein
MTRGALWRCVKMSQSSKSRQVKSEWLQHILVLESSKEPPRARTHVAVV